MMYTMYMMIRKQLYISDEDERALKERSTELGITEAELVLRGRAPRRPWRLLGGGRPVS
jgi:hypothetical protein